MTLSARGSAVTAPSRPSATTPDGCTPTPTSLRLLRGAVERGHSIGRLASLPDTELRHLAAVGGAAVSKVDPTRRTPIDTALLTAALQKYDGTAIDQQISRLASVLPPLEMFRDVLMPVLTQVGEDWHRGRPASRRNI